METETSQPSASRMLPALPSVAHFVRLVRRRRQIVLAGFLICFALGALYFAAAPRLYEARASLLILQAGGDLLTPSMTSDGARQILMPTYAQLMSEPSVTEGALRYLAPEDRIDFARRPQQEWKEVIRDQMSVRMIRRTNILEVAFRSRRPQSSVAIVNALVRSYLEFMHTTHQGTASEIIDVLTKERIDVDRRLQEKSEELLNLRRQYGDLGISAHENLVHPAVQRALRLNEALVQAQEKRLALQATQAALQQAIERGEDLQQHALAMSDVVGREFLLNELGFSDGDVSRRAELEKNLVQDRARLETVQGYLGPNHPELIELKQRLYQADHYLTQSHAEVRHRLAEVRQQQLAPMLQQMANQRLNEAWQHEQVLRRDFEAAQFEAGQTSGDLARLELLEHELARLQRQHGVLMDHIANMDLRRDQGEIRATVVGQPVVPEGPATPKLLTTILLCLIAGTGSGLGLAWLVDTLDDRFRSPEELQAQLGVSVLSMVRQLPENDAAGAENLLVHTAPDAPECEAFRTLRTALDFAPGQTRRLVISSAEPEDGKTTVLANLAVSYAQSGKRVLLIDADLRRPGLTNLLALHGPRGLTATLRQEDQAIGDAARANLHPQVVPGVDVIACGARPSNPAELLASARFAELLAWAEAEYDQVLIDSPPTLAASDTAIIGRQVDGVFLVVRPDKNQRRPVMRAVDGFATLGVTLLGVVVNRVPAEQSGDYYGYGGYAYGYGADYDDQAPGELEEMPVEALPGEPSDQGFDLAQREVDEVERRRWLNQV